VALFWFQLIWFCILVWWSSKFENRLNPQWLSLVLQLTQRCYGTIYNNGGTCASHTSTKGDTVVSVSEWSACLQTLAEWLSFWFSRHSLRMDPIENTDPLLIWYHMFHCSSNVCLGLDHVATLTPAALLLSHDVTSVAKTIFLLSCSLAIAISLAPLFHFSGIMSQYTYAWSWNIWQNWALAYSHILFAHEKQVHRRKIKNQTNIFLWKQYNSDKIQHFDAHWYAGRYWSLL
jgi:hypothetical protein